jgi:hypothetical protein
VTVLAPFRKASARAATLQLSVGSNRKSSLPLSTKEVDGLLGGFRDRAWGDLVDCRRSHNFLAGSDMGLTVRQLRLTTFAAIAGAAMSAAGADLPQRHLYAVNESAEIPERPPESAALMHGIGWTPERPGVALATFDIKGDYAYIAPWKNSGDGTEILDVATHRPVASSAHPKICWRSISQTGASPRWAISTALGGAELSQRGYLIEPDSRLVALASARPGAPCSHPPVVRQSPSFLRPWLSRSKIQLVSGMLYNQ